MKTYHEIFLKLIEENKITITKKLEKDPNFIQSIMNFAINNSSKILFKDLDKDLSEIIELNKNPDAITLTGAGSNAKSKMLGRVGLGESWFAK